MSRIFSHTTCRTCFISVLAVFLLTFCAPETDLPAKRTVQIAYSGNLNGILDDCQCGGELVGGATRIITVARELREGNADLLLLDAGDFFSSYSMPRSNSVMLELVRQAGFDALNLGDQEFVQGVSFLQEHQEKAQLLSSNIRFANSGIDSMLFLSRSGVEIAVLSMTDSSCFSFIDKGGLQVLDVDEQLRRLQSPAESQSDMQILLLHAERERALELADRHDWLDLIILAHNQRQDYMALPSVTIVEAGVNGEHLGVVSMTQVDGDWQSENRFIPITREIAEEKNAYLLVQDYYRTLSTGYR